MKIGVISDTHDRLENIIKAVQIFQKNGVSLIIHCGDWSCPFTLEFFDSQNITHIPIKSVFGNNEGDIKRIIERNAKLQTPIEFTSKQTLELTIENRKIVVYHGQDKVILNALISCQNYDAIFTGHTHDIRNEINGKTLILNPGTTSQSSHSKIINQSSVAIYDSSKNSAEIIEFS
jgi:uncharacterized protein